MKICCTVAFQRSLAVGCIVDSKPLHWTARCSPGASGVLSYSNTSPYGRVGLRITAAGMHVCVRSDSAPKNGALVALIKVEFLSPQTNEGSGR
jgi:hypothetical protein